ncbi:hypothetical protein TNCV_4084891 [Trichonephila clavipes]|nr:hypothetical protein TNCV_4084891 [Trichonephila clavipes]
MRPQTTFSRSISEKMITADTNGRRVVGPVQTNPACCQCQLKQRAAKSFTVATDVSYKRDFRWPQKKKRLRTGERGGQAAGLPHPIHFPRYVAWKWLLNEIEKCIVQEKHFFVLHWPVLPAATPEKSRKFSYMQVSLTLPRCSKSRAQTSFRWCGVVFRRGVPAKVSSTSLEHGSK